MGPIKIGRQVNGAREISLQKSGGIEAEDS